MKKSKKVVFPNLVAEMAAAGDTQKDVANFLNMLEGSISQRLSGTTDWRAKEMKSLSKRYNKPMDYLFETGD